MTNRKLSITKLLKSCCIIALLLQGLTACEETKEYFNELNNIPQVDMEEYAYNKISYKAGDSLFITGLLYPENGIKVYVNGVEAGIKDTLRVETSLYVNGEKAIFDQIKVLITEDMGIGSNLPVKLVSGAHELNCPAVRLYSTVSKEALDYPAILTEYFRPASQRSDYLYCVNGKGSIYRYRSNIFYRIKDGEETELFNKDAMQLEDGTKFTISTFYGGGVDPQEENLYFSAKGSGSSGYLLCRYHIPTGEFSVLNRNTNSSFALQGPYYQGDALGALKLVLLDIFPASDGTVYAYVAERVSGITDPVNAGLIEIKTDHTVNYLFKFSMWFAQITPTHVSILPGSPLEMYMEYTTKQRCFSPEDRMQSVYTSQYGFAEFYTGTRKCMTAQAPTDSKNEYGFFDEITVNYASLWAASTALMPFPGRKVLGLFGTKWKLFDFESGQLFDFAPMGFDAGQYTVNMETDKVLNYDLDESTGRVTRVYLTANDMRYILTTELKE